MAAQRGAGAVYDTINCVHRGLRPAIDLLAEWAARQRRHLVPALAHAIAAVGIRIDAEVAGTTIAVQSQPRQIGWRVRIGNRHQHLCVRVRVWLC
jgi:hypothetical protein